MKLLELFFHIPCVFPMRLKRIPRCPTYCDHRDRQEITACINCIEMTTGVPHTHVTIYPMSCMMHMVHNVFHGNNLSSMLNQYDILCKRMMLLLFCNYVSMCLRFRINNYIVPSLNALLNLIYIMTEHCLKFKCHFDVLCSSLRFRIICICATYSEAFPVVRI